MSSNARASPLAASFNLAMTSECLDIPSRRHSRRQMPTETIRLFHARIRRVPASPRDRPGIDPDPVPRAFPRSHTHARTRDRTHAHTIEMFALRVASATPMTRAKTARAPASGARRAGRYLCDSMRSRTMTRAGERYMDSERVRVYENADGGVTYSFDEDAPPVREEETVAAVEETRAPEPEPEPEADAAPTFDKQLTWVGERTTEEDEAEPTFEKQLTWVGERTTEEDEAESSVAKPISKMKKAELVALCEELGLDSSGTVAALRGRLGPAVRGRAT